MKYTLFTSLLAVTGVNCRVLSNAHHIEQGSETVEHLRRVPEGWRDIGAPAQDHKLHFRVAVRSVSTSRKTTMGSMC
jgi:tripeptidyl-peptidase-1